MSNLTPPNKSLSSPVSVATEVPKELPQKDSNSHTVDTSAVLDENVSEEPKNSTESPKFNGFKHQHLLDQLLEGKPDAFKAKLEALVRATGVTVDDPIFLILVASGRLELLIDEAPQTFGHILRQWTLQLETWRDKLKVSMELAQKTSVLEQEAAIAQAVAASLEVAKRETNRRFLDVVPGAGACLLAAMGLGVLFGMTLPVYLQGGVDPGGAVKLTRKQANALSWAMSRDGQLARRLLEWNQDYIESGQCLDDAKRLKIQMSYNNRPASRGFCTLWVKPPHQRGLDNN